MEYLINLVGNYSIGWGITIIAALVFLVLCYRKVESYFSDKAIHEKEKNEQFKKVMDGMKFFPSSGKCVIFINNTSSVFFPFPLLHGF